MALSRCPTMLDALLADVFADCDLLPEEYDVTGVADVPVDGFLIGERRPAREMLPELLPWLSVDLVDVDGLLRAVKQDSGTVTAIPAGDLGARRIEGVGGEETAEGLVEVQRASERELPSRVDVTYFDIDHEYETGTQGDPMITRPDLQNPITINTALVMDADTARQMAARERQRQWLKRESHTFALPPTYLRLAPTDRLALPVAGGVREVRLTAVEIDLFGPLRCTSVLWRPGMLTQTVGGGTSPLPVPSVRTTATALIAWSGNALRDADATTIGFYAAANATEAGDWPGCALWLSRDGGASYQFQDVLTDPAPYGTADTLLPPGESTGVWDTVNTLDVTMTLGTLETTGDADVLAGANAALVGDEVIQFAVATLLAPGRYRLSRLLRGRRGTDGHWSAHVAGERFLVLDTGIVKRFTLPDDLVGDPVLLKAVPEGGTVDGTAAVTLTITGDERKPWAPAHLAATRATTQDLTLSWVRRDRLGASTGLAGPTRLSEAAEAYDVEILDGGSVVRSWSGIETASVVYLAAQQAADFGDVLATVTARVYQLGVYGRGYPAEATLTPTGAAVTLGGGGGSGGGTLDFSDAANSGLIGAI